VLRHLGRVLAGAFSADGQVLATGSAVEEEDAQTKQRHASGGEVRLWQAATGAMLGVPLLHRQPVWALAFRPGNHQLLTGSTDRTARFFVVPDGTLLGKPLAHEGTVANVVFSPDGRLALTGSAGGDQAAWGRLWEMPATAESARAHTISRWHIP